MSKIGNYLKEVRAEMAHVSFPTRRQTMLFTAVVVVISICVALYLGFADYIVHIILANFFKK
jgi:preprotein translocase SecE subunit